MITTNTYLDNFAFFDSGASDSFASFIPSFTFPPLFNFDTCFNSSFDFSNNNFFEKFSYSNKPVTTSFINFESPKLNYDFKFDYNINSNFYQSASKQDFEFKTAVSPKNSFTNYTRSASGKINNSYVNLSKSAAFARAKNDSNLEQLTGGKNWSISEASFRTDIPFAKKGTAAILDKVATLTGENLVITSALGTGEANNPHVKSGYSSHHNAENPKLDIRINGNGKSLAQKLKGTGYFSRVSIESDHLDVQIDPSKYQGLDAIA